MNATEARIEATLTGQCPLCDSELWAEGRRIAGVVLAPGGFANVTIKHDDWCPVIGAEEE